MGETEESGVQAKEQKESLREKMARSLKIERKFIPPALLAQDVNPNKLPFKACVNCKWLEQDIIGNQMCTMLGKPIKDPWNGTKCGEKLWKARNKGQVVATK